MSIEQVGLQTSSGAAHRNAITMWIQEIWRGMPRKWHATSKLRPIMRFGPKAPAHSVCCNQQRKDIESVFGIAHNQLGSNSCGVPGLAERQWEGGQVQIGPVIIGLKDLRTRCIMTTFDPDAGQQDLTVLHRIRKELDGRLGLNSGVVSPGRVTVGDAVELILRS